MRKLFIISVFALTLATSCQNSNDEITSQPEIKRGVSMGKAESSVFAKDGYIHIVLNGGGVYYMGKQLELSDTEEARSAAESVKNQQFSRRANMYCQASGGGDTVSLIHVYGDGVPDTYWIVHYYNGQYYTYQNHNPSYSDCASLHFQSYFV